MLLCSFEGNRVEVAMEEIKRTTIHSISKTSNKVRMWEMAHNLRRWKKLAVIERKFLKRIYGPKKIEKTQTYEIRSNI